LHLPWVDLPLFGLLLAVMRAEIGGGGTFGIDERFALAAWMSKPAPFFRV
jgi:hypothetical protein